MNILTIWEPRYSTNSVLIAKWKVSNNVKYKIKFSKVPKLKGQLFDIDGSTITKYPVERRKQGQAIMEFYDVPLKVVLGDSKEQLNLLEGEPA